MKDTYIWRFERP